MGKIEDKDIDLHIDRETLLQEYIPKAQYEQRLKADMVAMLTELQLEIEGHKRDELSYQQTWNYPLNVCISIIQQKINSLKEQNNEDNG